MAEGCAKRKKQKRKAPITSRRRVYVWVSVGMEDFSANAGGGALAETDIGRKTLRSGTTLVQARGNPSS